MSGRAAAAGAGPFAVLVDELARKYTVSRRASGAQAMTDGQIMDQATGFTAPLPAAAGRCAAGLRHCGLLENLFASAPLDIMGRMDR